MTPEPSQRARAQRLLCVHQGGELYGSDRSFLQAVHSLRLGWPDAHIRVVLAGDGPLKLLLAAVADEVVVRNLWILRLSDLAGTLLKGTVGMPFYTGAALYDMARADLVYINTTVIADYIVAARFARRPVVIHAREIPRQAAMRAVRGLCRLSGACVIFNSAATARAFALPSAQRQAVVHNGVDGVANALPPDLPPAFAPDRPLRVAMLGRISDWKGQDLLIEAAAMLAPEDRARIRVRIVGGTFRDVEEPVEVLRRRIAEAGLDDVVSMEPFRDHPDEVYRWADLCVIPSRLPEPFGRVAVEAMAHGRPVIAAAHGGLVEIVEQPGSGWLFAPNDAEALADALREAMVDPAGLVVRARGAQARFACCFSTARMSSSLLAVLAEWVPVLGRPALSPKR